MFRYKFGCRLRLQLPLKKLTWILARLGWAYCVTAFWVSRFHFFFFQRIWIVTTLFMHMDSQCRRQSALFTGPLATLFKKKKIKNGSHDTIYTFKNYFATVFSVFSKISCVRTDPTYFENLTTDYMFFIFLAHMSGFVIIGYYLLYDA